MKINYKDLFTLTINEIEKRVRYNSSSSYNSQLSRNNIAPLGFNNGRSDIGASDLINSIMELLVDAIPQQIIEGLEVTAESPISANVVVAAGKGSVGGRLYELEESVTLAIPFDTSSEIFFVVLYNGGIMIEKTVLDTQLKVAKIVVKKPGITSRVRDDKDDSWDAYIVNFKEYKLYGRNDKFEEDTIELLRDNISPILADNLIGNIRLSEDLKITNTQGTLELDSTQLLLKDFNDNTLAKFNKDGTFFYNAHGVELAKFSSTGARIGNIVIATNALESGNFLSGSRGFQIKDDGTVEFNTLTVRGTVYATAGEIGGWTIADSELYATDTGTIRTSSTAGSGYNGVVLDKDGLRVYDDVLGLVVNLPSDGSAPSFASGVIENTTFEINTNAVLRTSETVGDGTASSYGILINNTGLYGCGASQTLNEANLKALITGEVYLKGEINASTGQIGSVTITSEKLSGGLLEGALIRGGVFENSASMPKIRIDSLGIYFQETGSVGKYGVSGSGLYGFQYGDGTLYGAGVSAYLFNSAYPIIAILSERSLADIRLYNRTDDPGSGTGPHVVGDLICVDGELKICETPGSPGTFKAVGGNVIENLTSDPVSPEIGQIWIRVD